VTDLVTVGETMLRYSPPAGERLERADAFDVHVAGAESNVAVAAARLGLDTAWLSKLPAGPLGRRIADTLRGHGVDPAVTWTDEGRVGTYYLEPGGRSRETAVVYDRADSAVTTATADELATDHVEAADALHTTGITPALSATLEETTAALLDRAQAAGTTTVFDVNYRAKLWEPAAARATLTDLLPSVDVLVVAERDARTVLDCEGDAEAIARYLADEYGFETAILTRGGEGALALSDDEIREQPVYAAADTYPIGTGDAFVGGFLSRYLTDADLPTALDWGAATAALKREIRGDVALVTPDEVRAVVEGAGGGIGR
jgi:2-dehydro-3-deoxygluconokinase